jgi:type VI secretion system Hcp family effector
MKSIFSLVTGLIICGLLYEPVFAQQSIFLDIPGYTDGGDETGITKNQVYVLGVEYSISNPEPGNPGATGKAAFSSIKLLKLTDAASMRLQQAVPMGKLIPQAKLIFYLQKANNTATVAYKITLTDVRVTGYEAKVTYPNPFTSLGTSVAGVVETITLSYGKILVDNRQQRAIGSPESAQPFSWDVVNNKQ